MCEKTKKLCLSESDLIYAIAGQLYDQAPNRQPRNGEKIIFEVRDKFRNEAENRDDFYFIWIEEKEIYKYIENMLMGIKEFVDLNLSQNEYEKGVSVDDENRPKFVFTSMYSPALDWRDDFIDLTAFIQNVNYHILKEIKEVE